MEPKFKEGDTVLDLQFCQMHIVNASLVSGGNVFYNVTSITGPGAYGDPKFFQEKELQKTKEVDYDWHRSISNIHNSRRGPSHWNDD